jgi:hypothetical protein
MIRLLSYDVHNMKAVVPTLDVVPHMAQWSLDDGGLNNGGRGRDRHGGLIACLRGEPSLIECA